MIGAFSPDLLMPMTNVLKNLGSEHVWLVHGDGMDELTVTGTSTVVELKDGAISSFEIEPEDAGVGRHQLADLKGGDAAYNAAALSGVLNGDKNAYRDMVLLNAGAGLLVAGSGRKPERGCSKSGTVDRPAVPRQKPCQIWSAFRTGLPMSDILEKIGAYKRTGNRHGQTEHLPV